MIRHHLAKAALALTLVLSAPAFAQAPALSPSHLQVAREVVELTGVTTAFDQVYREFSENTRQLVGSTRPEWQKDMNEIIQMLKPEADKKRDEIATTAVEVFARKMTESDLKEIAGFFKSPVGQRYNALRTQAIDEIFTVLQPWSVQTSNFLFDRFAQEMRKRGHQL